MDRYICIHGHFYQPPRENAWLEAIELQDSAYPHHDWNERITDECYAPNSASRILDDEGKILGITNNYERISFNFGPTLLSWMQANAPAVYQAILDADHASQGTYSGHGSAISQAYNHMIMPLSSRRDKLTQVRWGIADFEHRFGRAPEGMWLPETAVDTESLEVLAECGIRFTILAPHQVQSVRPIGSDEWWDVEDAKIDPTMAYTVKLPSGRSIGVFFYDGPISRAIAFERLLSSGESLSERLTGAFSEERAWPQIIHVATDGETFGHHHRFGDMALAFALNHIESNGLAKLTNYGEYLEKVPPSREARIIDNTSWSCVHGIERWRSDCGCSSGGNPGWNQEWRAPLREALDWLRDATAEGFEQAAADVLADPWAARDDYIHVILDRSPESVGRFVTEHSSGEMNYSRRVKILKLMEMQRHAMLMYTSCGWFFDDISGLETVQVVQYAGRVVQLAEELLGESYEPQFLEILERAKSNVASQGDGRRVYERYVKPAAIDLRWLTAHYAINSLFEAYSDHTKIYSYAIDREDGQFQEAGRAKLAVGLVRVASEVTDESNSMSFGVLHFGDHNVNAGVREWQGEKVYSHMVYELSQAFSGADFPEVIRLLDKHFGSSTYSLRALFRDEQRKAVDNILESTLAEVEASYRRTYDTHYPLMRFLIDTGIPLPRALNSAAEFILNMDLGRALAALDVERIGTLLGEVRGWDIHLDAEGLSYTFKQSLESSFQRFVFDADSLDLLNEVAAAINVIPSLPFELNLWKVQNMYHDVLRARYEEFESKAEEGDSTTQQWLDRFREVGEQLTIRLP